MSNYTIAVAWNGKDALSDVNPAKVISGDDFHTEFSAIQTATNSKAELNGAATESFSATTAASGTNTTQVATTAFVKTALALVYPVGAIFTTVTAYADSAAVVSAIGGTTWTAFGAGRVLVGAGTGTDSQPTPVQKTFTVGTDDAEGEYTHTLTTTEMPAHTHSYRQPITISSKGGGGDTAVESYSDTSTGQTGGGSPHNNVQPYITVYMWKRTA
jgi:microcystin-dependent protein